MCFGQLISTCVSHHSGSRILWMSMVCIMCFLSFSCPIFTADLFLHEPKYKHPGPELVSFLLCKSNTQHIQLQCGKIHYFGQSFRDFNSNWLPAKQEWPGTRVSCSKLACFLVAGKQIGTVLEGNSSETRPGPQSYRRHRSHCAFLTPG